VLPAFRDWPVPGIRRYALPWQAGFTGIVYNERLTGRPVVSMTDLLTSPDLHGRVSLVAGMRDVMGLLMLDRGTDPASFTGREFYAALTSCSPPTGCCEPATSSGSSAPPRRPRTHWRRSP
jgi:spermidine/putrescine transport system substrate-binding protein